MMKLIFLAALFVAPLQSQIKERFNYVAPDSQCTVNVFHMESAFPSVSEGILEFRTKQGKLLLKKNYPSKDGQHGYDIGPIGWTANSKFFLYTLTSSGGHQAWHQGVAVYSIQERRILNLEDYLGPITIQAGSNSCSAGLNLCYDYRNNSSSRV